MPYAKSYREPKTTRRERVEKLKTMRRLHPEKDYQQCYFCERSLPRSKLVFLNGPHYPKDWLFMCSLCNEKRSGAAAAQKILTEQRLARGRATQAAARGEGSLLSKEQRLELIRKANE